MYKIGDKVRVREEFWNIPAHINIGNIQHELEKRIGTVIGNYEDKLISIDFGEKEYNGWSWSKKWIEPYEDENDKFKKLLLNT